MIRGACGAFHVDAKRQGYVGMAECYGVDSLVESESAGHAVAEHLHDRSRQRQPQIVREKGREIFLECVRSAEGENERTNLILRQTRSEERRVGKGCVSTGRSRWGQD